MAKPIPTKSPSAVISIPSPDIRTIEWLISGDSPLICHRFGEKAKRMIEDKQQKKAQVGRAERKPDEEFRASLYPIKAKVYGFPASAFKLAALFACSHVEGVTKVQVKGAFHVLGTLVELLDPVTGKPAEPRMGTDHVRIGMSMTSVAYRGYFDTWACRLTIRYNANVMTAEQIVNLLNTAGFASGIGEWRPSSPKKPGPNGMFHVKEARDA